MENDILLATQILVVDDDLAMVEFLAETLTVAGAKVTGVTDPHQALDRVKETSFDLVISDIEMPEMRGPELMNAIHQVRSEQLVLLITAFGSITMAAELVRQGACDFIPKPFRIGTLLSAVRRALADRLSNRQLVRTRKRFADALPPAIIARSPAMQKVLDLAQRVAESNVNVILTGESGTGKSALARFIHDVGARSDQAFVSINCSAIPPDLLEAELFGHRRGAYTGAQEARSGLFVEADKGTLFLDEVSELPLQAQPKLLHCLELGVVRPLGGTTEVAVDARLITASNLDLEAEISAKRFRADLYFRLNVVKITIPPLRERPEDIEPLTDVLLERICKRLGREISGVTESAMQWLIKQPWPGNVRELSNVLERAVALAEHNILTLDDLNTTETAASPQFNAHEHSQLPLSVVEYQHIQTILASVDGNKAEAARILGIDRRTLYRKLEERDG